MTEAVPLTHVPRRLKLRVEDFLALDDAGAFRGYGRTELLDGEIVYMNAQHRPHARIKSRLHALLAAKLRTNGSSLEAIVEGSVALPPHDVPEPDIVLTAEAEGEGLIPFSSLALVIEVSDATLASDLGAKLELYARAGVPEYWVVDVNARSIHQMWSPLGEGFRERRSVPFGEPITAATIHGLMIETAAL